MATATKKTRTAARVVPVEGAEQAPMEFLVYRDNSGRYHWSIVSGSGATLVQSESFASYDDAELAASHVRDGIGSARFEPRSSQERLPAATERLPAAT